MKSGQFWQSPQTLNLVTIDERVHQPRRGRYWHSHPFHELGLVLDGACFWTLGTRRVLVQRGEAILVRAGLRHCEALPPGGSATLAWVGFSPVDRPPTGWGPEPIPLGDDFGEITQTFYTLLQEHPRTDPLTRERLQLALRTMLLLITRQVNTANGEPLDASTPSGLNPRQLSCVESATHYFRENLADCLSIAQVAAYHSLCPAHFSTLFSRHHGIGPRAYLLRERLEKAAHLLEGENPPGLKEIARQCGFADASHLCKAFSKGYAMSPTRYREKAQTQKRAPAAAWSNA